MSITKEQIVNLLRRVADPVSGKDLVSANMVRHTAACDGFVSVSIAIAAPNASLQETLRNQIIDAVSQLGDEVKKVNVEFAPQQAPDARSAQPAPPKQPQPQPGQQQQHPQDAARDANPLPNVRHIVAVGAGKGGVGKSTVSINLAVGLARRGLRVGLLDGDIYGPSAPTLLGLADAELSGEGNTIHPFEVHGIKAMTIGKMVDADKPLIWRGPMAHGAFRQLAIQTGWGELDYLIIDLPPGTGDVPLTLAQMLPLTGSIIVCTPQKVAQDDAVRAAGMFRQLKVDVLGVVENMSYFIGDDGKEYDIFGKGGAAAMAQRIGLPMLGTLPINTQLRANSDAGNPTANFTGSEKLAAELNDMVDRVIAQIDARGDNTGRPTMSIS
ncbi:MAG: P-loop NTPase [Phycisphaera sp.]|nr:P-loop NTPase [Phycisphaera sp.]